MNSTLGNFQNKLADLPVLKNLRYENIFRVYTNKNNQYYYNLLQSVFMPENLNEEYVYYQSINSKTPWTLISFNAYRTVELWWLICLTNQIFNPVKFPDRGTVLKIIKPQYVPNILNEIKQALK